MRPLRLLQTVLCVCVYVRVCWCVVCVGSVVCQQCCVPIVLWVVRVRSRYTEALQSFCGHGLGIPNAASVHRRGGWDGQQASKQASLFPILYVPLSSMLQPRMPEGPPECLTLTLALHRALHAG